MKEDKIFNNTFGTNNESYDSTNVSFSIAPAYIDEIDPDDKTHYDLLFEKLDTLIKKSQFNELNQTTKAGVIKKLNKIQINEVFLYVSDSLGESYSKIDLFSVISDYFDIVPSKFYNSLSNKFKDELIQELDEKYNVLEKKKIRKLF